MEKKDVVKLDNGNEYVVVSKVEYSSKVYYYLSNIEHYSEILICYEDNDELVEVKDKDLTFNLLQQFFEQLEKEQR